MKTKSKIFVAFLLNLFFSIFEFIGGVITGSVAITSDAVHDFGDAISIGSAFLLEKISEKKPNTKYTYGYLRFSVLGGLITTLVLLTSSAIVIYNAILKIINPTTINYNGMLIFAVIGLIVNLVATFFTHGGKSLNQKAVNLHMLEDVLGWLVVLVGAIVIKLTNLYIIDPILSIIVALFVIINSIKNLIEIGNIFILKTPKNINLDHLILHLRNIQGVKDVHHVHVWSLDGQNIFATLHIVCAEYDAKIKNTVKDHLSKHGVGHSTIEMETENEKCLETTCIVKGCNHHCHHHHHH